MIDKGFASVFVTIFNEANEVITNKITRFKYTHSDALEDNSSIVIKAENPDLIDHPNLQVDQRITVAWGYTEDRENAQKRILYIYDVKHAFDEMGIRITLECMCKAGYLKFNDRTGAGELSMDELLKAMSKDAGINYGGFDFAPPPPLELFIQKDTTQPAIVGELSTEVVTTVDWSADDPDAQAASFSKHYAAFKELGATDEQAKMAARREVRQAVDAQTKVQHHYTLDPSKRQVAIDATAYKVEQLFVQAGKSDAETIEDQKKRNPVKELQVTGRDDDIFVNKRRWDQPPYKSYTYKQHPGHLLKFTMDTHNKEAKKAGTQIDFSVVNAVEKSIQRGSVDNSNNTSPALGKLIEMTREGLSKMPQFKDLSVMVSGIRKKNVFQPQGEVEVQKAVVSYEEVQFLSDNDTYVAVISISGSRLQIEEFDKSMFYDDKTPEKYTKPPRVSAFGHGPNLQSPSLRSENNGTGIGEGFNATHVREKSGGMGFTVATRIFPVSTKAYIQQIAVDLKEAAQTVYNQIAEDALKLREASIDVVGDPGVISGKIISIANVGKIWSGNYYIHKAIHEIGNKGYIVKCELYKNSMNQVSGLSDNFISARDLGIPTNTNIAAVESIAQGSELAIIAEETRPDIPDDDS